jgi:hypothetical protein
MVYYLDFIQLQYIPLTFTFGPLPQDLVSFKMVQNFKIPDLAMTKVEYVNIAYI